MMANNESLMMNIKYPIIEDILVGPPTSIALSMKVEMNPPNRKVPYVINPTLTMRGRVKAKMIDAEIAVPLK